MLQLYTNPMSRGRMVRWMLEELGEPYEVTVLNYGADMRRPDYLALNPMGKVPCLVHDGTVVTEVAAICAYLAETFPEKGLNAKDRAAFLRWLFFAAGPVEAAVLSKSFGWEPEGVQQQGRAGFGSFDRTVDALAAWLGKHDYIADGRFTAADVYVGGQVIFGLTFGTLPERPEFTAYSARLRARPGFQAAAAKDDDLLAGKAEP